MLSAVKGLLGDYIRRFSNTYYIHNWPLQLFIQDYGLASHATYVVCIIFIREWRYIQLTSIPNERSFEKFSHDRYIYSQSFC